jgi:putative ABC transport system permease protein
MEGNRGGRMLDISLKNILARKTRSILTVLGVAVCIMLFLFMTGTVDLVKGNLNREMAKYAGMVYVKSPAISVQSGGVEFPPTSSVIDVQTAERILAEIPGIDRERSIPVLFKPLTGAVYPGGPSTLAVGVPAGKEEVYLGKAAAASGKNRLDSDSASQVILGSAVAASFKAEVGKTIALAGEDVIVKGILEKSDILATDYTVLLPLEYAQGLFRQKASVSAVLLNAGSVGRVESVVESVNGRFPKLETMSQKEMAANMDDLLSGMNTFFNGINAVAILVALVVVLVVMVMAVSERTREIGTLRAIGAKKRTILGLIVQESAILSLIGGILGVPLCFLMNSMFYQNTEISLAIIPQGIIAAVAAGVIGSLYPAWRATRVNPLQALRYE